METAGFENFQVNKDACFGFRMCYTIPEKNCIYHTFRGICVRYVTDEAGTRARFKFTI